MQSQHLAEPRKKTPLAPAIMLLSLLGALAVLVVIGLARNRADETQLSEARQLLQQSWDDATHEDSLRLSRAAAGLLDEYLEAGGEQVDTARLLLAAALATEFALDQQAPTSLHQRTIELVGQSKLAEVDAGDLLLAEELLTTALRFQLSDRIIDELLSREQHRAEVLRRAIKVREKVGRDSEVLALCDQLAKLEPDELLPWQYKTRIFQEYGFHEGLVESTKRIMELSPESADEYQPKLVRSLIVLGRTDEARQQYESFHRNFPNSAKYHKSLRDQMRFLRGDAEVLEREILPPILLERLSAILLVGRQYASQNEAAEVEKLLKQLEIQAEQFPKHIGLRLALAELHEAIGNGDQAGTWRASAEQIKQSLSL